MRLERFSPALAQAWDDFVHAHSGSHPFHQRAWGDAVTRIYGFQDYSILAMDGEAVAAVMPLSLVRRPLGGSVLLSSPFATEAGVLASDPMAADFLLDAAVDRARALGVALLEVRGGAPAPSLEKGWHAVDHYAGFRKALPTEAGAVLGEIPRKQRAEVRKARKSGLSVVKDLDAARFHALYAQSVHRLGSPTFSRAYADAILRAFGAAAEITTVEADGRAIASVLTLYHGNAAYPYYAGATVAAGARSAYPLIYADGMERAVSRGCTVYDFGRSSVGTGAYVFKRNFGFSPEVLAYRVYPIKAREIPNIHPDHSPLRHAAKIWRHVPRPLADRLGPWLLRQLA